MKKYYGNYLGIVIQNNDPQGRGRVKIFVPHISPTVYKNWNEVPEDKKFKFLGGNINSDLNDIYEDLKLILPWSICASPVTGEMTSGRFNAFNDHASISDSSYLGLSGYIASEFIADNSLETGQQNEEGIGEKEGNIYEKYRFRVNDAFNDPVTNNSNNVNLFSFEYAPSMYSNKAKGAFAIPAVGSHVWVFFHNGDPLYPVYFAASYGKSDWNGIYGDAKTGYDYPGSFENVSLSASNAGDQDLDYYKNKYIINQKGGTIEFINSDYRESIKISGYNGSFKQFALKTNVEFATHNDQKLVQLDQFDTVKGFRNIYTGRDLDYIVKGDYYQKIGNFSTDSFQEWHNIVASIANIKQLFEIRRANAFNNSPYIKLTSTLQQQQGNFAPCPVCLGENGVSYNVINNDIANYSNVISVISTTNNISRYSPVGYKRGNVATTTAVPPVARCVVCGGTGISPSSMGGVWVEENKKSYGEYESLYKDNITKLAAIEEKMGLGGNHIIDVTKNKIETIGLVMNDFGSIRLDTIGKIYNDAVFVDDIGVYEHQKESPLFEYVHVDDLPGGTYTLNVANRYNVQVGAGGLSLKSYGRADISGTITNVGGQQVNISSENEVNINGGERLTLEANIVSIKNKQSGQVLIDSNFGVNGNAIIRGGLHVDGELSVNHITAPTEFQETELTQLFGKLLSGLSFTAKLGGFPDSNGDVMVGAEGTVTLIGDSNPNLVQMYDHSHHFRNIPLTLTGNNSQMRIIAKANNAIEINAASPVVNEKKIFTNP
jgi:hypothetical protein